MTAHDGARADVRKRHEAEDATHAPASNSPSPNPDPSATATPVGPQIASHVVARDEWERFENVLRWHFNVAIHDGKDSSYISLGIQNARNDAEQIMAPLLAELDRVTAALARVQELADEWAAAEKNNREHAGQVHMLLRPVPTPLGLQHALDPAAALTTTTTAPTTESKEDDR